MAELWRDAGSLARSIFSGKAVHVLAPTRWASCGLSCSSNSFLRTDIGALQALLDAAAIGGGRGWARTIECPCFGSGKDLSQLESGRAQKNFPSK